MAFDPYNPESRTLTITRNDPWGTHVGYDTKITGAIIASPTMSNRRFGEIQTRVGFPLLLEAKTEMMATFSALVRIPNLFGLDNDDTLAWRYVTREIGDVYRHEKSYFDRLRRPADTSFVSPREAESVYETALEGLDTQDTTAKDAAERVATWIELAGLVEIPTAFAAQQQQVFMNPPVDKESLWDYTGTRVW